MPDEILRTFIAIELDEPLRIALRSIQEKLKRQAPPGSVKWVGPDGIHLTLKFLGDTPQGPGARDRGCAARAPAPGLRPFEFSVEGRGCFPNFRRPRVIWVAVREKSGTLARLQAAVERTVAPLGLAHGRARLLAPPDPGAGGQGRGQPDGRPPWDRPWRNRWSSRSACSR